MPCQEIVPIERAKMGFNVGKRLLSVRLSNLRLQGNTLKCVRTTEFKP